MNNFTVGMLSDSELLSGISISMQPLHAALAVVAETAKRSVCRVSGAQCSGMYVCGMVPLNKLYC